MRMLAKTALLSALALGVTGTAAAEWTKTYVIEWYEPAHYYGAKEGVVDPGTDCPKGSNPEPELGQGAGRRRLHRAGGELAARSLASLPRSQSRPEPDGLPRQGSHERLCESRVDSRSGPHRRFRQDRRRPRSRRQQGERLRQSRRAKRGSTTNSIARSAAGSISAAPRARPPTRSPATMKCARACGRW